MSIVKNNEENNISFHNNLNKVVFKNFKPVDFNLFFTICYFARNKRNSKIAFSFKELKRFLPEEKNEKRFFENIVEFVKKLNNLKTEEYLVYQDDGNRVFTAASFFDTIIADEKKQIVMFKIHDIAIGFLNDIVSHYTSFNMYDFCSIKGTYPKNLFRLLAQYKNLPLNENGLKEVEIAYEEFNILMNTPEKFSSSDIDKEIIKPSISALCPEDESKRKYFNDLTYKKIKDTNSRGRGGIIKSLVFSFSSMQENKEIPKMRYGRKVVEKREKIAPPRTNPKLIIINNE